MAETLIYVYEHAQKLQDNVEDSEEDNGSLKIKNEVFKELA